MAREGGEDARSQRSGLVLRALQGLTLDGVKAVPREPLGGTTGDLGHDHAEATIDRESRADAIDRLANLDEEKA
eukprot:4345251-Alexandrium_andersonii.AAC.1